MAHSEKPITQKDITLPLPEDTQFPAGVNVVPIQSQQGKEQFSGAVKSAKGSAAIIVHPFFPEVSGELEDPGREDAYEEYSGRLHRSVELYQKLGIPIVIMEPVDGVESEGTLFDLPSTLDRMGITGDVYVAATKAADPELIAGSLEDFSDELHAAGMTRASVNGSYMVKVPRGNHNPADEDDPAVLQKHQLQGCAGYTTIVLNDAGIDARPGISTFSSTYLERIYKQEAKVHNLQPGESIDLQPPGTALEDVNDTDEEFVHSMYFSGDSGSVPIRTEVEMESLYRSFGLDDITEGAASTPDIVDQPKHVDAPTIDE